MYHLFFKLRWAHIHSVWRLPESVLIHPFTYQCNIYIVIAKHSYSLRCKIKWNAVKHCILLTRIINLIFTFIKSFKASTRALHTSGNMNDIIWLYIKKKKNYCKLVYESPVAKNRSATANPSFKGTASLRFVAIFWIWGLIRFIRISISCGHTKKKKVKMTCTFIAE